MSSVKKFVTVGGGLGSFCFYGALRIHGVPRKDIAIISRHKSPYHQFKIHCDSIGLRKLRSDSGSRPDNFWGFPGYGLDEASDHLQRKEIFSAIKVFLQLFFEPVLFGYYCPDVGVVCKAVDKEAKRTGWIESLCLGEAVTINKLDDGRFELIYKDIKNKRQKIIAEHIHLALGHGSSSYKNYDRLFEKLKTKGGKVLVIGRGTSAARMVERLLELKSKKVVEVISLHRNELPDYGDSRSIKQRQFLNWRLQQFNWPRSAFGGELKDKIHENGSLKYIYQWGLPSAVPERYWTGLVEKKFHEGRYKVVLNSNNMAPDYIIDCTGFNENPKQNRFYRNLIRKYNLPLNPLGNIKTGRNFEIEKLCTYKGRVSATGIATAGNFYGPVDSFFGHQYAALKIIENTPDLKKLNFIESFSGWYKWLFNKKI